MPDKILRRPEVETLTGLSRSTIYELITAGRFPRPLRIGKRAVGWTESCIQEWINSRDEAASLDIARNCTSAWRRESHRRSDPMRPKN